MQRVFDGASARLVRVPSLEDIRRRLKAHEPLRLAGVNQRRAAVAMVLRGPDADPELLFIKRAERDGDPWSGQMAFPGGRCEPEDSGDRQTAERETHEEVGLLLEDASCLGRLDDQEGRPTSPSGGLVISAHVYEVGDRPAPVLCPNEEVAEAFWFPVSGLLEGERHVGYEHPGVASMTFPGIVVGDSERHVVWGLTYRFLEIFLGNIGYPLPERWSDLDKL